MSIERITDVPRVLYEEIALKYGGVKEQEVTFRVGVEPHVARPLPILGINRGKVRGAVALYERTPIAGKEMSRAEFYLLPYLPEPDARGDYYLHDILLKIRASINLGELYVNSLQAFGGSGSVYNNIDLMTHTDEANYLPLMLEAMGRAKDLAKDIPAKLQEAA